MQKWITTLLIAFFSFSTISAQEETNFNIFSFQSDFLNNLPTRDLNPWLYGYFSGTVVQSYRGVPYLHVHGSRADEVGYQFEGVNIRSDYTGLSAMRFIPEVLGSVSLNKKPSVSQGTASALVSHTFRNPTDKLRFSIRETSDAFTSAYEKRMDTYSYGYNNLLFTGEGKLLDDKLQFIAGFEMEHFDDHYRKFWPGFTLGGSEKPLEIDPASVVPRTFEEVFGTDKIVVKPGNVPAANSDQWLFNGMLTYKTSSGLAKLIFLEDKRTFQENDTPIRWIFNQKRIPETTDHTRVISAQFDAIMPFGIKSHLQADYFSSKSKTWDPLQKNDFLNYREDEAFENIGLSWGEYKWSSPAYSRVSGFFFDWDEALLTNYQKREETNLTLKFDIERSFNSNKLKSGLSINHGTHRYYRMLNSLQVSLRRDELTFPGETFTTAMYYVTNYGFNLFGEKIDNSTSWSDGPRKPQQVEIFLEDEIRFDQSIFTFGLNYLKINTGAYRYPSLNDPIFYTTGDQFQNSGNDYDKDKIHNYFLPNFTWHFEQNNRLTYQLQIARSASLPKLDTIYMGKGEKNKVFWGSSFYGAPKGPNANPVKSTNYYLGADYNYSKSVWVNCAFFYRSSDSWLQSEFIRVLPASSASDYSTLSNGGENQAKGFELNIHAEKPGMLLQANYTFSNTKGTASHAHSNVWDEQIENPLFEPGKLYDLDFNQSHRLNAWLSLYCGENKPSYLRNSTLSLLWHFNSGHSFWKYDGSIGSITPHSGSILSDRDPRSRSNPQKTTTPWIQNIDLLLQRKFTFGQFSTRWFIAIQNLFNRQNEHHVYWRTGNTNNDGTFDAWDGLEATWIDAYGEPVLDLYQKINTEHRQHYTNMQGGDLFGHPREIRFGVALDFGR
ncbi:MAG: TonB-dependent receptor [Calditrichaeota bacterium]|nr:MAG: TonB-dependent receptor [Calditrichota bacterium]